LPAGLLRAAVEAAHALGKPLALAVNAIHAPAFRNPAAIMRKLRAADALGVDAFIVSNPQLLRDLSAARPRLRAQLHLSSVQPVFNTLAAAFFLRFGVSRIILPNQLRAHEAREIISFCLRNGVESEIFDYRFFGCAYINGRCQLHRPGYYRLRKETPDGSMCRVNARPGGLAAVKTLDLPERAAAVGAAAARLEQRLAGGGAPRFSDAAAFFDMLLAGASRLKYGTRHDPSRVKVRKVRAVREMLDLAEGLKAALPPEQAARAFTRKMSFWDGSKL